jgi:O-acetylhomoserine/O-acetylserine sulfhydrylase-like pyridoxal-dependent enzyme
MPLLKVLSLTYGTKKKEPPEEQKKAGQARTTTTHQRLKPEQRAELGISDGMIRLSFGLEAAEDVIADLDAGLARATAG